MSWTEKRVSIEGTQHEVTSTDGLVNKIKEVACNMKLSKFKVYLNDSEIDDPKTMDIENIADGDSIEIKPYDKAADEETSEPSEPVADADADAEKTTETDADADAEDDKTSDAETTTTETE